MFLTLKFWCIFSGNFSWNLSIILLEVSLSLIVFSQFPSPAIRLLWLSLNWNVVSRFAFWQFPNFTNISHFYDYYDTYWSLRFLIAWSCSRSPTVLTKRYSPQLMRQWVRDMESCIIYSEVALISLTSVK